MMLPAAAQVPKCCSKHVSGADAGALSDEPPRPTNSVEMVEQGEGS